MNSGGDVALPLDLPTDVPLTAPSNLEEFDMPALPIGAAIRVPELAGRWSVWSQVSETPGGYCLVPLDDEARSVGVKYAVIRARTQKGCATPTLTLLRTDPTVAGLVK